MRFAHTETGRALDPADAESAAVYRARFNPAATVSWMVVTVPDGTAHGAIPRGNGDYNNPDGSTAKADNTLTPAPPPPAPQPNTPNNPYFGKIPKIPKDFWGLVLGVFIGGAGTNAGGLDRLGRLQSSIRAMPIVKIIDSVSLVDPDDRNGDFLRLLTILTTTAHETDGRFLLEPLEAGAIMQAWK